MDQNKKTEKPKKYLFQGQSARSKRWFDIDIDWLEEEFIKREPQFYKKLFQSNIQGQAGSKYPIFLDIIVN